MARNLYRLYLYIIFIALIIFAVVVTSQLLNTLFALTPLRGPYETAPSQAQLVQAFVFALVGWIVSGALGGLHYWLIRRDQQQDTEAGNGAIRSFFLNITEAIGSLIVITLIGFSAIGRWAFAENSGISSALGSSLPVLAMVIGLELERRRFEASKGAALVFQRLHFFGVQLILLSLLFGAFSSAFRPLVDLLVFSGKGLCSSGYCQSYNGAGLALELIWFIGAWLVYSQITRNDTSRLVRMIMHGLGLASSMGWLLYGVFSALVVALSPLFHISIGFEEVMGLYASHDFISPLAAGLLSSIIYHLLLRNLVQRRLIELPVLQLLEGLIAALLLASVFWWGLGTLLYDLLQTLIPTPTAPAGAEWVWALALFLPGLGYIPLDLVIRHAFKQNPTAVIGIRRSFVLALMAGGILALAIGGSTALYAWGTALLGSPINNWPQLAQSGLAVALVGIALIAIYIWPLLGEHLLTRSTRTDQPTPQVPSEPSESAEPATLEGILDAFQAGRINRAETALRIRALNGTATLLL